MKKRILSLLLAITIIASFGVTAMATDVSSETLTLDHTSICIKPGDFSVVTASLSGIATTDVTWSTNDPSIATVSSGTVTGAALGMTTVTATSASGLTASCTVNVAYKGIDVSKYQKTIDWNSVKASGIDFAIIRTGFGGESWETQTDPYFNANYTGATQAGLKVGAYHFSYATTAAQATQEANLCLNVLNGRPLDYPVVYDIETSAHRTMSSDALADVVSTFCSAIQTAGYKVAVYSSPSIFNSNLSSPSLDSLDRWVANWGVSAPNFSKPYTMWQYGYGTVPGITTGVVDLDYSYKDYSSNGQTIPTTPTDSSSSDTPAPPAPVTTLLCDTSAYTFGSNNTYCYKITTDSATAPKAASSNSSVVSVAYSQKVSGGYIYKITNVNAGTAQITTTAADGSYVFFLANGKAGGVICDTTMPFTMKRNATYQFKLTPVGNATNPKITTGNGSVLSVISTKKIGSSYYIKVLGKAKGCTSVYTTVSGQSAVRQCMITVA